MKIDSSFQAICGETKLCKTTEEIELIPIQSVGQNQFHLFYNNRNFTFTLIALHLDKNLVELKLGRKLFTIQINGPVQQLIQSLGYHSGKAKHTDSLLAPMPGVVLDILVSPGKQIIKGEPLIILEAMKMENILKASHDGTVNEISISKGDKVEKNKILISFT